ncbi:MAG: hypothetical protein ACI8WB_005423 [Phenylobacterium sp.]|jgi:hypothetical protein
MEINLPKPPTSNLYIFLAVLGLMVALASYIHADKAKSVRLQKIIEFSDFSSEMIFEAKNLEIGFDKVSESEKQKIRNKLDLNSDKFEMLGSLMMVYSRKSEEANVVKSIGGISISVFGFLLWYRRTQVPKDKILKNQTKNPRSVFKKI